MTPQNTVEFGKPTKNQTKTKEHELAYTLSIC